MRGINKVIAIGNLGQDPETKFMPDGTELCTFSIACNDSWKDKQTGEIKERAEWMNIEVWGKQASACAQYLSKGKQVYVEGSLRTDKWQDKEGNDRWTTKVKANVVQFLGGDGNRNQRAGDRQDQDGMPPSGSSTPQREFDDDIPF